MSILAVSSSPFFVGDKYSICYVGKLNYCGNILDRNGGFLINIFDN